MQHDELARRLVEVDDAGRTQLLQGHPELADVGLAHALKAVFDDTWNSDPPAAGRVVSALRALADTSDDPEIAALAAWTDGMAAVDQEGRLDRALQLLQEAEDGFRSLGQHYALARTRVFKLYVLALLGRYDEAFECGLAARETFVAHGDDVAAGKIEQNLGNIHFRRDRYAEAEKFYRLAEQRFARAGEQAELARVENNLGNVLAAQHRFKDATQLYERALTRATGQAVEITHAEIECNLGCLALYQGTYDKALDYLERSRRRYAALDMPHESAIAEQEVADAYLELNLAPEALALYERLAGTFGELGMRSEQARTLAHLGRALLLLGRIPQARDSLEAARELYASEDNIVGAAVVRLAEAQLHYQQGEYAAAADAAEAADPPLAEARTWGRLLLARWIAGEARRALGETAEARSRLEATLVEAEQQRVPQVAQRCLTSLGRLASESGDIPGAREYFRRAVELIDGMRAPLPADEFRTAFVSDKLTPYNELVRLCLMDGDRDRIAEALGYVERARSRALLEMVAGAIRPRPRPRDAFEEELLRRLDELRQELNWFYSQINRPAEGDSSRTAAVMEKLHAARREREDAILEINRQIHHRGDSVLAQVEPLDLPGLQKTLGPDTALVEYFSLDSHIGAFVVTDKQVGVVRELGAETEVEEALQHLQFQIDTLRHGARGLHRHLDQLTSRAYHHLGRLYELLISPLNELFGERRLAVVPHRVLHYVPFHALYDGERHVIDEREVCYAPSAGLLQHSIAQPQRPLRRALLLGNPDARTPRVVDEVLAIARLFPESTTLLGEESTLAALRERAPGADVMHLACHGQFRPDNPLFSSVRLADDWLTVRDAYGLDLDRNTLVVLSACETGISSVAPGDELIGLARGFFSAGAASLLVSLWTVDDESTAKLMTCFYQHLQGGDRPAAALRQAQIELKREYPHPYYWSPFVLLGRW